MAHINTLKFYDDLTSKKVPEEQARVQANTLYTTLDGFATKDDLQKLEADLKSDFTSCISLLESRLDANFRVIDANFGVMKTFGWAIVVLIVIPAFKIVFFK